MRKNCSLALRQAAAVYFLSRAPLRRLRHNRQLPLFTEVLQMLDAVKIPQNSRAHPRRAPNVPEDLVINRVWVLEVL
jgi:hypothetical protein